MPQAVLDVRRFRPNILIETDGNDAGFTEQKLVGRRLSLGNTVVEITEPCTRCAFTALGQPGIPFDKDVLHAIARHGGGGFGVLASVMGTGRVACGDGVTVV
ncbi:MOSC domain-containing protein [Shinella sumterensis]|uniref:MOSC domain-containing protein n=1 Tax=Shinella sumterensis TaxID=1967501 RepID=UPI001E5E3BE2|nr:MOSC domain-containing protein [Shinella sumterensis]